MDRQQLETFSVVIHFRTERLTAILRKMTDGNFEPNRTKIFLSFDYVPSIAFRSFPSEKARRLKDIWSSVLQRRDDLSDQRCQFIESSIARSKDNIIRFVCTDDDQQQNREIIADKEVLSRNSSFYRSMFSGSFNESTKIRFDQNADDFEALEVFIHFLYNCKKCPTIEEYFSGRNALKILFYCLEKSDEHLRADIYDHLVDYRLAKLIERSILSKLIWRATMNDRSNLLEICMIFYLLKSNFNDLLENRRQSDDNNYSEEFKNDNCCELAFQTLKPLRLRKDVTL
uniref:BTB domain-containing protein n=1 Tax=Romanomermis culicivorax TaxID=13658 RepID=A0A915JQB8_ROMCU